MKEFEKGLTLFLMLWAVLYLSGYGRGDGGATAHRHHAEGSGA